MLYLVSAVLVAISTMVASSVNAQPTGTFTMRALGESAAMIAHANALDAAKVEANGDTTPAVLTATKAWKHYERTKGTPSARKIAAKNFVNLMLNPTAAVLYNAAPAPSTQIAALMDSVRMLTERLNGLTTRVDSTEIRLEVVRLASLEIAESLEIYGDKSRRSTKARRKELALQALEVITRLREND